MKNNRRKIKNKEREKKSDERGRTKPESGESKKGKRKEKSQKNVLVFRITIFIFANYLLLLKIKDRTTHEKREMGSWH